MFDKTANSHTILLSIDDFSIFYQSIIFARRYYLIRNPKEEK
jgi:hypothetical protein